MNQQVIPADLPLNIVVNAQNLNKIIAGIGSLPYNDVAGLLEDIRRQADQQIFQYLGKLTNEKTTAPIGGTAESTNGGSQKQDTSPSLHGDPQVSGDTEDRKG